MARRSQRLALLDDFDFGFSGGKSNLKHVPLPTLSPPSSPQHIVAEPKSAYELAIEPLCRSDYPYPRCHSLLSSPSIVCLTTKRDTAEEKLASPTHHTPGGTSKQFSLQLTNFWCKSLTPTPHEIISIDAIPNMSLKTLDTLPFRCESPRTTDCKHFYSN
jgi:hypothetical protein